MPEPVSPQSAAFVSVIICTRNRGANILPTALSILACEHRSLELLILDQSEDSSTRDALAELCRDDQRLAYYHLDVPGKPRALNRARALARGRYLLLTDDDCEVLPDWIENVIREFEQHPDIGCVFGRVEAAPHDSAEAYVPVCRIEEPHTIGRLDELLTMPGWGNFGMGANMSLRADALERIGGWDECIGPGAKFGSGDDHDLSVRLLRAGYPIRFSPSARAIHYGMRRWSSAGRDYRRIWFGVGGVFAKHLKCGVFYPGAIRVPLNQIRECTVSLLRGSRPRGLSYVASWLHGFAAGFCHPVNREVSQFVGGPADAARYADRVAEIVLRSSETTTRS